MIYITLVFNLSFLSLVLAFIAVFSVTTIQLLLTVVGIVFIQGLILISLGSSIIGSYIMIIYIGAIVILFAFCILFINSKEIKGDYKNYIKKLLYLVIVLSIWRLTLSFISTNPSIKNLDYSLNLVTEINYMTSLGTFIFSKMLIPLFLMLGILLLGLLITIKIIKNRC